ncbi:DUF488 family protein, N3 subclade [Streptomyces sp. NPDC001056]
MRVRRIHEPPDAWLTPSAEPRTRFHGGGSYEEFRGRYEAELDDPEAAALLDGLRESAREAPVTLPAATRTPERRHAQVLLELLGG